MPRSFVRDRTRRLSCRASSKSRSPDDPSVVHLATSSGSASSRIVAAGKSLAQVLFGPSVVVQEGRPSSFRSRKKLVDERTTTHRTERNARSELQLAGDALSEACQVQSWAEIHEA
eukprot:2709302-Prymnesium_polylepis.1